MSNERLIWDKLISAVLTPAGAAGLLACAKPEVSPDSREDLELMMSAEGYPDPPEEEKREVPKE